MAQYCLDHDDWANGFLVMLREKKLEKLMEKFDELGIQYSYFKDSHFGNKVTAIAAVDVGEHLKELELI